MFIHYSTNADIIAEPDVLVCGIGCAGVAAAVAAARTGAETMAVEQWPSAGGNITSASVTGCCGLADMSTGELAVGGIALELLDRTGVLKLPLASKKLFEPMLDPKVWNKAHTKLPYAWNVEKFKIAADRMLQESGVRFLYHTKICDVAVKDSRIETVFLANKSGITAVKPKIVIDCTGDGDVAAWSGVPYDMEEVPQVATLVFSVGNVRIPENRQEIQDKCAVVVQDARREGRIGIYGGPWLSWPAPGIVRFNATRLPMDSTSPEELTQAELNGREDAWRMFELFKEKLPEFQDSYFLMSGPAVGARESRRIRGEYTLTKDDILSVRRFPDAVVKGAWYLDRHPADAPGYHSHTLVKAYDIPYRTLIPQKIANLLIAGRCHSATTEALASSRVGVTAMGMGHAAGVAAAISLESGIAPREVDIALLRGELLKQGAVLDE